MPAFGLKRRAVRKGKAKHELTFSFGMRLYAVRRSAATVEVSASPIVFAIINSELLTWDSVANEEKAELRDLSRTVPGTDEKQW